MPQGEKKRSNIPTISTIWLACLLAVCVPFLISLDPPLSEHRQHVIPNVIGCLNAKDFFFWLAQIVFLPSWCARRHTNTSVFVFSVTCCLGSCACGGGWLYIKMYFGGADHLTELFWILLTEFTDLNLDCPVNDSISINICISCISKSYLYIDKQTTNFKKCNNFRESLQKIVYFSDK